MFGPGRGARRKGKGASGHIGMSVDFERAVRSASEAHDRALEGAQRGIEIDGARSRKVGRRSIGWPPFSDD